MNLGLFVMMLLLVAQIRVESLIENHYLSETWSLEVTQRCGGAFVVGKIFPGESEWRW